MKKILSGLVVGLIVITVFWAGVKILPSAPAAVEPMPAAIEHTAPSTLEFSPAELKITAPATAFETDAIENTIILKNTAANSPYSTKDDGKVLPWIIGGGVLGLLCAVAVELITRRKP